MMELSIIILSYNTKNITDECLSRLHLSVDRAQKSGNKIEVIVLDNASTDGSVEMIRKNHRDIKLIESSINTGFSKGNNLAIKQAKYPLVLFLNSDVYVENDTLFLALKYFTDHSCDVLGVKLLYEDGRFQPSGGNLPSPLNTVLWILGMGQLFNPFHPKNKRFFSVDKQVGWIMGAFFMIKKEAFKKAGGFDEKIFMYMDEVDLCKRLNLSGFKICYTPSISVTHLHRASLKDFPEQAFSRELSGIGIYFRKYFPTWYGAVRLFLTLGLILRVIVFSLLGKTARARAYMEGIRVV